MNESSWDAHGVEIGACAIFANFRRSSNIVEVHRKSDFLRKWRMSETRRFERLRGSPIGKLQDPGSANPGLFMTQYVGAECMARLNLDAMAVRKALVHSIRILVSPAVVLTHQWRKC